MSNTFFFYSSGNHKVFVVRMPMRCDYVFARANGHRQVEGFIEAQAIDYHIMLDSKSSSIINLIAIYILERLTL